MKAIHCLCVSLFLVGTCFGADPKEEVQQAAKKLSEKQSYSWKSTVNNLVQSRFRQGPTEGQTEKGGFTKISMSFGDNSLEAVMKGEKGAIKADDGWQSLSEATANAGQQNRSGFMARFLTSQRNPAELAADLANKTYGITKSDDTYRGDLNQEALKQLLSFGRRSSGGDTPPEPMIRDAAGTVKFWITDGVLTKLEYSLKGMVSFGGNERSVDRVNTVEIKDIDSTKVDVPEEAKSKAS